MAAIQGNWYASAGAPNEAYPERDGTVRFVYADQPNGERFIVAKAWAGDDQDYEGTARLIAAAPELLSCCQRLLEIVEAEYEADPEPEDLDTWRAAIQLAVDCIAKAEGRE